MKSQQIFLKHPRWPSDPGRHFGVGNLESKRQSLFARSWERGKNEQNQQSWKYYWCVCYWFEILFCLEKMPNKIITESTFYIPFQWLFCFACLIGKIKFQTNNKHKFLKYSWIFQLEFCPIYTPSRPPNLISTIPEGQAW